MIDRLVWVFFRRFLCAKKNVKSNIFSYVCKKSVVSDYSAFSKGVKIENSTIGFATYVSANTNIVRSDIGKFCSIGPSCLIGGLDAHPINRMSTHPSFYSFGSQTKLSFFKDKNFIESKRLTIGNDVWIGVGCIILPGCKIGDGAIIAAGSVVVKDVPDYCIVGGVPAKFIKRRFSIEVAEKISSTKWWDSDVNLLKKNSEKFLNENIDEKNQEFFDLK